MKRPPVQPVTIKKPEAKTAPSAAFAAPVKEEVKKKRSASKKKKRDPRVASIVDDVMRRSAAGFGKGIDADAACEDNESSS